MKFGLLTGFLTPFFNYGDFVQSMAIEYLYQQMNIDNTKLYHITSQELKTYDGEPLLLPFNYFFTLVIDHETGSILMSDKIIPVFLGLTLADSQYGRSLDEIMTKETISYFKKYSPIGCRDEYTRKTLDSFGIPCYLQGCLTNILPIREALEYKKIFFINCPIELLSYVPLDLLRNAEILENSGYTEGKEPEEVWQLTKQHYDYIKNQAALVVSSRYHAVSPCYAMGIPSIFIKRIYDQQLCDVRLDTLNPYIPIYTEKNFSEINWEPAYVNFEAMKKIWISLAVSRIQDTCNRYEQPNRIAHFFQKSIWRFDTQIFLNTSLHKSSIQNFVAAHYNKPAFVNYYIWGAKPCYCQNQKVSIAQYISEINSSLHFGGWIDTYKKGELAGKPIFTPQEVLLEENDFLIIASEAGIKDSKKFLTQRGINETRYVVCVNQFISQNDILSTGEKTI